MTLFAHSADICHASVSRGSNPLCTFVVCEEKVEFISPKEAPDAVAVTKCGRCEGRAFDTLDLVFASCANAVSYRSYAGVVSS